MYIYIYIYEYIDSLPFILEPASWKLLLKLFRKKKKNIPEPCPESPIPRDPDSILLVVGKNALYSS